jgi:hypothetical protein
MGVMTSFEFRGDCAAEFLNLNGNVTHCIAQNQQQYHAAFWISITSRISPNETSATYIEFRDQQSSDSTYEPAMSSQYAYPSHCARIELPVTARRIAEDTTREERSAQLEGKLGAL